MYFFYAFKKTEIDVSHQDIVDLDPRDALWREPLKYII